MPTNLNIPLRPRSLVPKEVVHEQQYDIYEGDTLVYVMKRGAKPDVRWHLYDTAGNFIYKDQFRNDIFEGLKFRTIL